MRTTINIILTNLIVGISLIMGSGVAQAASQQFNSMASLDIVGGSVSIFAPSLLDFGSGKVLTQDADLTIDMLTYSGGTEYFGLEDLRGSDSGYSLSMVMSDLSSSNSGTISKNNIFITLSNANSGITVLGQVGSIPDLPPQITIPSVITRRSLGTSVDVLQRHEVTTPTSGIVGKYGLKPLLTVLVPRYQQIGSYMGLMTLTLTEY